MNLLKQFFLGFHLKWLTSSYLQFKVLHRCSSVEQQTRYWILIAKQWPEGQPRCSSITFFVALDLRLKQLKMRPIDEPETLINRTKGCGHKFMHVEIRSGYRSLYVSNKITILYLWFVCNGYRFYGKKWTSREISLSFKSIRQPVNNDLLHPMNKAKLLHIKS